MSFNFKESKVEKTSKEIRDTDHAQPLAVKPEQRDGKDVAESKVEAKEEQTTDTPVAKKKKRSPKQATPVLKTKKTSNGIVIDVPMEDYMQLMMLKIQTGKTLKELTLQAVHEFVKRNKIG